MLFVVGVVFLGGCAETRRLTITTQPPDAQITVDGALAGIGRVERTFAFASEDRVYNVTAQRPGYVPRTVRITRGVSGTAINLELSPETRNLTFNLRPVPGDLLINGQRVASKQGSHTAELPFPVEADGRRREHRVRAERAGFIPVETLVRWSDTSPTYDLTLEPEPVSLTITSDPANAEVMLDGQRIGTTPISGYETTFAFDARNDQFRPKRLTLNKPGYPELRRELWRADAASPVAVTLEPLQKVVKLVVTPAPAVPEALLQIEGQTLALTEEGTTEVEMIFKPLDERGTLPVFRGQVTTPDVPLDWEPSQFEIAWDEGKAEYVVELQEILTRQVPLTEIELVRRDRNWVMEPNARMTIGMKRTGEPGDLVGETPGGGVGAAETGPAVKQILVAAPGESLVDLAVSPDGSMLAFSIVREENGSPRSLVAIAPASGQGSRTTLSAPETIDLTPSFTPDGAGVLFASNRGGDDLDIYRVSARGEPGVQRVRPTDTMDLYPVLDSEPQPRLYYQSYVNSRSTAVLNMNPLGTPFETDLTTNGGEHPRIDPRNARVVFSRPDEQTGLHDIFIMDAAGGFATNLTNTPDVDERHPAFSPNGGQIVFAAQNGANPLAQLQYDLVLLDLNDSTRRLLTTNLSHDDHPVFAPTNDAVYFRSNRGGAWGIWRVELE